MDRGSGRGLLDAGPGETRSTATPHRDGGRHSAARPFGVLALQGDFAAHAAAIQALGAPVREVRRVAQLSGLAGLMIPGGESTTLLNLMRDEPWFEALRAFHDQGGVLAGTCAGAILLSREVTPIQPSLGLLGVTIERNAWGRQVDSFEAIVDAPALGGPVAAVFIRAPRFRKLDPSVEVLGRYAGEPVLLRQGRVIAATFHPELTGSRALHRYVLELAARP
jgi:5'-phosphate synthase pdxT subunit